MKILFIHPGRASWVERDIEILKLCGQVQEFYFKGLVDIVSLWLSIRKCDMTFSWFSKLHAFFAVLFSKILGKKSIVVAGGDDVAYEPEIGYGMFSSWWKKWCPLFVFKYADLILPVSKNTLYEAVYNSKADLKVMKLIYHGFDHNKFKPIPGINKEQIVITVGGVDWERYYRKGYEWFVKSAAYLPEVQFALIGKWHDEAIDYLRQLAPDNVEFTGWVSDKELLRWFSRAKVYVQASIHEGFGCSVAEAMLCECIPVVSNKAALPEVVGDCGFYVDDLNPENVAREINKAISASNVLGKKASERIKTVFPLEKRKMELLEIIDSLYL